jgi:hypothetical protein
LDRRLGKPQAGLDAAEKRIILPLLGIKPWTFSSEGQSVTYISYPDSSQISIFF